MRHINGDFSPPDFGRIASLARWTSWSTSSLVSEARRDSLPFWSLAEKRLVCVGTRKPRMELASLCAPVLEKLAEQWPVEPLVIHLLPPFSTQPSFDSL